jgi:hypothetical protein
VSGEHLCGRAREQGAREARGLRSFFSRHGDRPSPQDSSLRAELRGADKRMETLAKKARTDPLTTVVKIQRRNGQVVQDCDVYIGRPVSRGGWNLPNSKWANPFTVAKAGSVEEAVALFESYLLKNQELMASIGELRGKVLGCWCKPGPCHGDVLARLANSIDSPQ